MRSPFASADIQPAVPQLSSKNVKMMSACRCCSLSRCAGVAEQTQVVAGVSWNRDTSPERGNMVMLSVTGLIPVLGPDSHSGFVPWWCFQKTHLYLLRVLAHLSLHRCWFGTDTGFILKNRISGCILERSLTEYNIGRKLYLGTTRSVCKL